MIIHPENIPDEYKFTLNPIHPHCGPFNVIRNSANGPVDAICRMHDIAYRKQGPSSYIKFSEADKKFIIRMSKQKGLAPWAYRKVFELKKLIAPEYKSGGKQTSLSVLKKIQKMPKTPSKSFRGQYTPITTPRRGKRAGLTILKQKGRKKKSGGGKVVAVTAPSKVLRRRVSEYRPEGIKTGKKVFKKYYSSSENAFLAKGIVGTKEYHTTGSDTNCYYVGHGTCPADEMVKYIASAMYKMAGARCGLQIINVEDKIVPSGIGQSGMAFDWYVRDQSSNAVRIMSSQSITNLTTWSTAIGLLETDIKAWLVNTSYYAEIFERLEIQQNFATPGTVYIQPRCVDLTKARVMYKVLSTLKWQNQSFVNDEQAVQESEEAVDRVPVIGKVYTGKHGGTSVLGGEPTTGKLFATQTQGLIAAEAGSVTSLKEPPPKSMFANVYKVSGFEVDPGSIQTDRLSWSHSCLLNTMLRGLNKINSGSAYNFQIRYGKFRFYAIEKKLNSGDTYAIRIAFELNQQHMVAVKAGKKNFTRPLFLSES